MMEYLAYEDCLLLFAEVSVLHLFGRLESNAQLPVQQVQLIVLTPKSTLFLKSTSHLLWNALWHVEWEKSSHLSYIYWFLQDVVADMTPRDEILSLFI